MASILKKSIWRHNSTADRLITTKFGSKLQNVMQMITHTSNLKMEVQFQYGIRLISETGSSFISAVHWDILHKFGRQIDYHLLKQIPSLNLHLEVHFRFCGRHVEKSIWRRNFSANRPITTKFDRHMEKEMPLTAHTCTSKSEPEVEFQYGGRPFFETGSSFISAMDWDISFKFGMEIDLLLLKQVSLLEIA